MAAPPAIKLPFRQRYTSVAERTFFGAEDVAEAFNSCFDALERRYPGRWSVETTHVAVDYSRDDERVLVVVNALVRYQDEDDLEPDEPQGVQAGQREPSSTTGVADGRDDGRIPDLRRRLAVPVLRLLPPGRDERTAEDVARDAQPEAMIVQDGHRRVR